MHFVTPKIPISADITTGSKLQYGRLIELKLTSHLLGGIKIG